MSTAYAKTYFVVQRGYYSTNWIGAFSFCNALGLDMITFDSQSEQEVFMKFLRSNYKITSSSMGNQFNIYLGAYAIKNPAKADGFVWYQSGQPTSETVDQLDWYPSEPNNSEFEMCGSIMQLSDRSIGINDYSCTKSDVGTLHFNNAVVCQRKYNVTTHGMKYKF